MVEGKVTVYGITNLGHLWLLMHEVVSNGKLICCTSSKTIENNMECADRKKPLVNRKLNVPVIPDKPK